jgi:hypothetical protein
VRKTLLSILALTVLLGASTTALAQGMKPWAVVSFAGYDRLVKDLEVVGGLAGNAELRNFPDAMIKTFTFGKGLPSLDAKRPWGVVVGMQGEEMASYGFLPVTDLKQVLDAIAIFLPKAPEKEGDVFRIETDKLTLYAKQMGAWAVICVNPAGFANIPADPSAAAAELAKNYDLAFTFYASNLPPQLIDMFLMQMQGGFAAGLDKKRPGETDAQFAMRKAASEAILKGVTESIKELDKVSIGLIIDPQTKKLVLDYQLSAKTGSKLAANMAADKTSKTNFAGFNNPAATFRASLAGPISESDIKPLIDLVEMGRASAIKGIEDEGVPADLLNRVKPVLNDLFDVLAATIKKGRLDAGAQVSLDAGAVTIVAGGVLADGAKLEKAVKEGVKIAADSAPDAEKVVKAIKFDAETYKGVRFHVAQVPVPPDTQDRAQVVKMFGETATVVLAVGDESVFLAGGKNALAALRSVIDKSAAEPAKVVPPFQASLALLPLMQFAAEVNKNDPTGAMLAGALAGSQGKDHLSISVSSIENGVRVRFELEEGILKAIGAMSKGVAPGGSGL